MSKTDDRRITLNRETNESTRRLKKSLNKVKWSHALMQIFWTAGPVTTLGLIGGYYIGYGTMPSMQLLIYFVSFTVFSGILGLVAKVIYDGTNDHLEEQSERDILNVTDKLADLILVTRDKVVQGYEGEARQREAALQLLRRVDLTSYGVQIAFTDLTGDRRIGEIMGQIYAYRKIGLQTKVRELYAEHQSHINRMIDELNQNSPQAARELKKWFTGNTSGRLKYGVPREKYFLQRIMSAIENNNPYLMTYRDVEEMMILAFELINGREIPTLTFSYSGKWKYASVVDELERKRSQYRVAQAKGGNRMRALSAYLVEAGYASGEQLPEGLDISLLIARVTSVMDRLAVQARQMIKNKETAPGKVKHLSTVLENSVELYRLSYDGYKEVSKRHQELELASKKWEEMTKQSGKTPGTVKVGSGRRGVRIKESVIFLNEEERLDVCRHLSWYFDKEDINRQSYSLFSSFDNQGGMSARRLAVEIAVALEPHIKLSKPEIQRNINATKAIYLGGLSPDMSAVQKQELGIRMAKEADNEMGLAAIRLADTLVHQYNVELGEDAIEFLHYNYNAGLKSLKRVAERKETIRDKVRKKHAMPPALKSPKQGWLKSLNEIKRVASKL